MDNTGDTRDRLVAAAAELFAKHGFHGTKARDIAQRGGVNLAASNYHFGSKRDLYLEVLRRQFSEIRSQLDRNGANLPAVAKAKLSRQRIEKLLRARSQVMLDTLIGPSASLHGALMQHELANPSEALPFIARELVLPLMDDTRAMLAVLAPKMSANDLQLCVFSVVGQALFYRFAMPLLLQILGVDRYPKGFASKAAEHIAEFSLGGLDRLTRKRRHAR